MELLKNISAGMENLTAIEAKLFDVQKLQLHTGLEGFNSPLAFGMYKGTGGQPLGVVGKDFTPQSPKMMYDMLCEVLRVNGDIDASKVNFVEMRDGARVRFTMPVGKVEFINKRGQLDESIVTLNIQTGYDGLTKTSLYLSTYRMVCANGMKATITEFAASFKNTSGNVGKGLSLVADVSRGISNISKLEEMYKLLNRVEITKEMQNDFIQKVTGYNVKEYAEWSKKKQNILDRINESVAIEIGRTGATAFGLLNGITHFTNHSANGHTNPDYIFTETGASMNDKALKFALEMAN